MHQTEQNQVIQTERTPDGNGSQHVIVTRVREFVKNSKRELWTLRVPVEILSMIFECYVRLDCPVRVLLQVNRRWRSVALFTQPLWRRLLLSADAIPPSLRGGSVHACDTSDTVKLVLQRSGVSKLEVTFVLGPNGPNSPKPEDRAALFKTVKGDPLLRVTFLCIIINPQMTLDLVTQSLEGVFAGGLPSLESMMIASAYAIGNLYGPLEPLLKLIEKTSPNLRSVYLENVNRDFIIKASAYEFWTQLARLTIRNETDAIDASIFALCANLEFLSFSGELSYGEQNLRKPVEFLLLQWLRVGVISMGTLKNLRLPVLHSMVIHTVQGNYPISAPDHHTLVLKELKILHVTTVNPSVACIVAPKLETLCLGIPTLKNADADNVLNAIFDGTEFMIKPRHLTLTAPVHDKHLISALRHLPDLMSLQLDHQVPFSKTFFQAMTPALSLVPSRHQRSRKSNRPIICPKLRCLVLDLHRAAAGMDISMVPGMESDTRAGASELTPNWIRESLLRLMELRKEASGYEELLRLACKWSENAQNEELVQPTMCLSCIEVKAAGEAR